MIYLDNAATSFPKPRNVIKEVCKCISEYCGNPGRSSHSLSVKTSEKIYDAREKIASFFGFDKPENIVFTNNATTALNIAIKTSITPGSHILISDLEHNSVLRPLCKIATEYNIEYDVFDSSGDIAKSIQSLIKNNTKYIISTLASNVIGRRIPFSVLSEAARNNELILITDASQLAGHSRINLSETPCDILCSAGHKALFGIQGVGFIIFSKDMHNDSFIEGGSGSDSFNPLMPIHLPERYEAGTLSSPSVISLAAGIEFINNVGIHGIEEKIKTLESKYYDMLSSIKKIKIYEYGNGIISFNISDIPSFVISEELNKHGICTRSGYHCAPSVHRLIGTEKQGTVRISLSYLNSLEECDTFRKELYYIAQKY